MTPDYDLAVIGGGPAGVAGALTAALAGLGVVLLDAAPRLGGQYFRRLPGGFRAARPGALHPAPGGSGGLDRFTRQCESLAARADVLTGHRVWAVERDAEAGGTLAVRCMEGDREERPRTITARRLLIATGAHDRPLPFPGWDLPGVLTAGGAQALLKGDLVVAGRRVVVAGTGPFLLPVAAGLAAAGARVLGVHEAAGRFGLAGHPFLAAGKAAEALGYGLRLARHRVPYRGRQAVVEAHGEHELTHVTIADLDRDWRPVGTRTVACDTLATGYGFVPRLDLPVQLGCALRVDQGGHGAGHGDPVVAVDAGMRTSVPGVYAAGETTGVGGAVLAETEGRLAGRSAAADLGRRIPPDPALARRRDRLAAFARVLLETYPVRPGWREWLRDDTLVCRCEEVPLAAVREARELGATDARSVKLLSRAGMGWCQGRMCGYAVSCLAGEDSPPGGSPPAPRRAIAQPVRLGDLARLATDPPAGEPPATPPPSSAGGLAPPASPTPSPEGRP
ncbi:FAD-dependent oxidoreductase [Planomonospora sp. ID67723]|uniref:FAD/NAD(P)-dependent oxidoreductase n=1 Tax=Planomonospora sp. ID67723 TaxID=2738134 RepID=UPI0018C41220|nr:NAD(P)/FAD-dependent oxidoreductase [Planomonospora sp. ID67723]MBG0832896.1 FAD-dependent oxidoreductase [Planomonospora sp. ID67723]